MNYDKPYKQTHELISLLESRNITISDKNFAGQVLNSLSYYTVVNGNNGSFPQYKQTGFYPNGTRFEDLYNLHMINTDISNVLLKYILFVERYLKTRIANLVSDKYGVYTDYTDLQNTNPDDYLCRQYYHGPGQNKVLTALKNQITSPKHNASVEHYIQTKNHVPAWILVTTIPLGMTIRWYSILRASDKSAICNQFLPLASLSIDQKKEFVKKSLDLLHEFRNHIAHGDKIESNPTFPMLPKSSTLLLAKGAVTSAEYNSGLGRNDVFAAIISMFILIDDNNILNNFLEDIRIILTKYAGTSIAGMDIFDIFGLPRNVINRLKVLS